MYLFLTHKGFEILCVFCRGFESSRRFLEPSGAFWQRVRFRTFFFEPSGVSSEFEICRTLNEYAEPSAAWKSQKIQRPKQCNFKGRGYFKKSIFSSPAPRRNTFARFSGTTGSIHSLRVRRFGAICGALGRSRASWSFPERPKASQTVPTGCPSPL